MKVLPTHFQFTRKFVEQSDNLIALDATVYACFHKHNIQSLLEPQLLQDEIKTCIDLLTVSLGTSGHSH